MRAAPETWAGGCHCGAVRFRVRLSDGLATASRCDCSFCTMRGAVAVTAPRGGITFERGGDSLTLYQFNTGTARHHFCPVCGIYIFHQRRSNPDELGVNLACLDGCNPYDLAEIPVNDGRNHPSDGGPARLAGVLKYEPEERP